MRHTVHMIRLLHTGSYTSVDFYFSRIRGIKMGTNNSGTKQGAVVPTDLLQQKPYVEVIPT
jgi:hypothetical protein